jgi:DNA-binding beta-propeller fold protein YncE
MGSQMFQKKTRKNPRMIFVVAITLAFLAFSNAELLFAAAPTVTTGSASSITKTTAVLNATVDSLTAISASGFEYGLTTSYGSSSVGTSAYANTLNFSAGGDVGGVDVDSDGNIYVGECAKARKYDSLGNFLLLIDSGAACTFGSGGGVAVDLSGNIYVSIYDPFFFPIGGTIFKHDSLGVYQSTISGWSGGSPDVDDTIFPQGLETDSSGNLYVADGITYRIQKFNSSGTPQFVAGWGVDTGANSFEVCTVTCQIGIAGSGNGQFNAVDIDAYSPSGIAVDSSGNIYATDSGNDRIQKFNSAGAWLSNIGSSGSGNNNFNNPSDIDIDLDDNMYITDTGNNRVQKFDSSGAFVESITGVLAGTNLSGIAVDEGGSVYFTDIDGTPLLKKYSRVISAPAITGLECGTEYHFRAFATNADGTSYGSDNTFTTSACDVPTVETKKAAIVDNNSAIFNGLQTDDGAIASTARGFQYGTSISYGSTTSNLSPSSLSEASFATDYGVGGATGITKDAVDNIYIAGRFTNNIQVYDSTGNSTLLFGWGVETGGNQYETCTVACTDGIQGPEAGQFDSPEGVAVDPTNGDIYVADTANNRVQAFDSAGTFLRAFGWGVDTGANALEVCTVTCQAGIAGDGDGQYSSPKGINITRINSVNYLYVVDSGNNRIQKLNTSGTMLDEVGGLGSGSGQFNNPTYIYKAILSDNLYVADSGNSRIYVVSPYDLEVELVSFTNPAGLTTLSTPEGVALDSKDNLYVTDSTNNYILFSVQKSPTEFVMTAVYSTGPLRSLVVTDRNKLIVANPDDGTVDEMAPFMSLKLKPLSCATTYHYRAYATNVDGTGYGADETFTTSACGNQTTTTDDEGCTDPLASNYDSSADIDDGSCEYLVYGCTDTFADNYNSLATDDDGTCTYTPGPGCMNPLATNYNPVATSDNGSCVFPDDDDDDPPTDPVPGCTDTFADNYDPAATIDPDNVCEYTIDPTDGPGISGCTNPTATNYNASATTNDGTCIFPEGDPPIITTIVEVVEDITGLDRDEQIDVYKGIALGGLIIPSIWLMIAERSAIASIILRLWNIIPTLLGFRRRRRPWGTVYDSVTKQPLDPVYVALQDKSGNEVSTSITDIDGRYGFVTDVGSYVLDAKKGDYTFPSAKLKGQDHDELYEHLYFGEDINIDRADSIINKNIPMDAVNFNWNEFEKAKNKKLMKFFSRWELFLARIARVVFFAGFVASVMLAFLEPHFWNYAILALYILIIVLMLSGVKPRQPGFVVERSTGYPLSFAILTVYSAMLKREVAHTIVGKTGKYHVLVPKGRYYIKLQKKTGEQTYEDIYTSESFKVRKGYIDKVIKI